MCPRCFYTQLNTTTVIRQTGVRSEGPTSKKLMTNHALSATLVASPIARQDVK